MYLIGSGTSADAYESQSHTTPMGLMASYEVWAPLDHRFSHQTLPNTTEYAVEIHFGSRILYGHSTSIASHGIQAQQCSLLYTTIIQSDYGSRYMWLSKNSILRYDRVTISRLVRLCLEVICSCCTEQQLQMQHLQRKESAPIMSWNAAP